MNRWICVGLMCLGFLGCGGGGGGTPIPAPAGGNGGGNTNPTELATGLTFQNSGSVGVGFALGKLWAAGGRLFWFEYDGSQSTAGGRIRSVAQGGGATTTHITGLDGVNDLAIDATHLYWTGFSLASGVGALNRLPLAGGAVEPLVTSLFFPKGLAHDAAHVYVGENTLNGAVLRWPKAGGGATPFVTGTAQLALTQLRLAIDATTLFLMTLTSGYSVPLAGGTPALLGSGGSNLDCLSLDSDTLYFVEVLVPRVLLRLPKTGGTPEEFETNGATNLVSNGTHLYWCRNHTTDGTHVLRRPKTGGAEELLGSGGNLGALNAIVVVGTTVFLLDLGGNQTGMGRILQL